MSENPKQKLSPPAAPSAAPSAAPVAWTPGLIAVSIFTAAYVLATGVGLLVTGNREFLFYFVILLVLIALIWTIHKNVKLTIASVAALSFWGFLHMAGGIVKYDGQDVLYNFWLIPERLKYDQVVHLFGFGVTTWVCWQALKRHLADPTPRFGPLLVCWAAGMGFGALNEVIEFIATLLIENTNVGDFVNTGWDLVSNLVGATIAVVLIGWLDRPRAPEAPPGAAPSRP